MLALRERLLPKTPLFPSQFHHFQVVDHRLPLFQRKYGNDIPNSTLQAIPTALAPAPTEDNGVRSSSRSDQRPHPTDTEKPSPHVRSRSPSPYPRCTFDANGKIIWPKDKHGRTIRPMSDTAYQYMTIGKVDISGYTNPRSRQAKRDAAKAAGEDNQAAEAPVSDPGESGHCVMM